MRGTRIARGAVLAVGLLGFAAAVVVGSSPARAQVATIVASTCVPDEAPGPYEFLGAKFEVIPGMAGTIGARCNVLSPLDGGFIVAAWPFLQVTYQDPDGIMLNYRVRALLYQVPNATAVPALIATFDSNAVPAAGVNTASVALPPGFFFDFANNGYFIALDVFKAAGMPNTPFVAIVRVRP